MPHNPYLISNKIHLNNVRNYSGSYFKITQNIRFTENDFSENGIFYNNAKGWVPIGGTNETAFFGVLDGNNFAVEGLHINPYYSGYGSIGVGLFGQNQGVIQNLGMKDGQILSLDKYAGGIAAINRGVIHGCYHAGDLSATASAPCAAWNYGTISCCYNTGDISASSESTGYAYSGGITSYNAGGIFNCYNTGSIYASSYSGIGSYAGGISGKNGDIGIIKCCYNIAFINTIVLPERLLAGYAGGITSDYPSRCYNCYNAGNIWSNRPAVENKYTLEKMKEQATFIGFDFSTIWEIDKYCDYSYPQLRQCPQEKIDNIKILFIPNDGQVTEGMQLNWSEGKIELTYNTGTHKVADLTADMVSGFDNTKVGKQTLTVTYQGKTTTFEVTVRAKTLTEIRVTKQPAKRTYLEGDAFEPTGMEITAYYDNGTSEVVTDYGISGYDSTPGVKRLTVTYGGKTAALEVTVRDKALVSIAVTKNPDQMTYVEGTALDTTGMELTLVFDNGTKEVLATGWTETYDFSQPGRQEVRIDCRGKTTTLTVMVLSKTLTGIAVSRLPNKLTYIEGNAFSAAGMEVTAYYDNNTSEIVTDRVTIQGYDSAPGIKTMAISYQGKEASFTVTVEAKKPVSIAWKAKPNKTVYVVGEELSLSGAVILIRYNNGTTAEQQLEGSWGADQYNPNQIGTQTIYIRYQETPPISFTVTVKSRVPTSITSGTYSVGGGFLSKVGAGTTAAQLLGGINEKDYCKVYKGNTEVTGNALVGTGMVVKLLDGSAVKQTVTIVVTGDTNGDGSITITDMLAVKAHVLKKSALAGAAAKAADTSGDKVISITDFIQIKAHILGKDKIQPRAC